MNYLDSLPLELLHEIAQDSEPAYKALTLAYPRFARAVTPILRIDYMIGFGHGVHIKDNFIVWTHNGKIHRRGNPAIINAVGDKFWYLSGVRHRGNGPAIIHTNGSFKMEFYIVMENRQQFMRMEKSSGVRMDFYTAMMVQQ